MKTITNLLLAILLLSACNSTGNSEENESTEPVAEESEQVETTEQEWMYRGDTIDSEGAIDIETFKTQIEGKAEMTTKLATTINSCCKKKGCWMKVDLGDGEEMRVTFKDYGFFVPLDAAGMEVVMEGKAYYDTTSVDMLRHYAEDAGKDSLEIAQITEPKLELAFEATGVLLK